MNTLDQTILDNMTSVEIDGVKYVTPDESHRALAVALLRLCQRGRIGGGVSPHRAVTIHSFVAGRPDQHQCAIAIDASNPEDSHYSSKDCNESEFEKIRYNVDERESKREAIALLQSRSDSNPDRRAENLLIAPHGGDVKCKMKSPKITKCEKITYCESDMDLAKDWVLFAETKTPWRRYDLVKFATDISTLRKISSMSIEQINDIFTWIKNDEFWSGVAISPGSLSKSSSKTGLRKIDTILLQMKNQMLRRNPIARSAERKKYEPANAKKPWNPWSE